MDILRERYHFSEDQVDEVEEHVLSYFLRPLDAYNFLHWFLAYVEKMGLIYTASASFVNDLADAWAITLGKDQLTPEQEANLQKLLMNTPD